MLLGAKIALLCVSALGALCTNVSGSWRLGLIPARDVSFQFNSLGAV